MLAEILHAGIGETVFLDLGRLVLRAAAEDPAEPAPDAHCQGSVLEWSGSYFRKGGFPTATGGFGDKTFKVPNPMYFLP